MSDPHLMLDQALAECAARITGDHSTPPRPGQVALAHDALNAMLGQLGVPGQVLGCAPTGTGKALAIALPAFLASALNGERAVISTESKSLQAQLLNKDLPLISTVVYDLTGVEVKFAVHKGFANYACPLSAHHALSTLAEQMGLPEVPPIIEAGRGATLTEEDHESNLNVIAQAASRFIMASQTLPEETRVQAKVAAWALLESVTGGRGDRSEYEDECPDHVWSSVSVSPDECLNADCPLAALCPARAARKQAGEADVLVTNHTLLALQAANAIPVVLGNKHLGQFHHMVIDEAHALPGIIRSVGAREVSSRRLHMLAKRLKTVIDSGGEAHPSWGAPLDEVARTFAQSIDAALRTFMLGSDDAVPFTADTMPLTPLVDSFGRWAKDVQSELNKFANSTSHGPTVVRIRRVRSMINSLTEDLELAGSDEHHYARWVEETTNRDGSSLCVLNLSPVDVAAAISLHLFQAEALESQKPNTDQVDDVRGRVPLSVTMVSATLPFGFAGQVGLLAEQVDYESPFASAYRNSMLYVPKVSCDEELRQVGKSRSHNKSFSLDVALHARWCAQLVVKLVSANGGRALVLAATAANGRLYADALRAAAPHLLTYSQWDGLDSRQVVQRWRDDEHSVLVGTRSMMTGVDAAGETCSLVILDRAPRNPSNVVDDARSELLRASGSMNQWEADRAVYVADAALLLEQATGRLIRRIDDAGLVAVLDPRLMKDTPISYPEATRAVYMSGLARFVKRSNDLGAALNFLQRRRDEVASVA